MVACRHPADPSAASVDPLDFVEVPYQESKQAGEWRLKSDNIKQGQ
jgi:hypothetical protein